MARTLDSSDRPLYRKVADDLRQRIVADEYSPGQLLPSQAHLSADYGVGVQTARKALAILEDLGLVDRERGEGFRVANRVEVTVIEVGPEAVVKARVASFDDRELHGVAEGLYILVVTEGGKEDVHPAALTEIRYRAG